MAAKKNFLRISKIQANYEKTPGLVRRNSQTEENFNAVSERNHALFLGANLMYCCFT
jgi:hypothetical protein